MSSKPTFFISSTIYDFADLRSSIKFYLEEQGCVVLASEFNDFTGPLDSNSYDACLKAIESADYFVLLVGARVGGWYDEPNKISITRQEYRHAYELHKAGRLKILAFVRSQIWAVKDDRKELAKFIEEAGLDPAVGTTITARPSKAVSDSDFLLSFLEEVGKNKENAAAVKTGGIRPTGNWIYTFAAFRDVIDTLRAQVFAGLPREQAIARRLLRGELRENLANLLVKGKDTVGFYFKRIPDFASNYPIQTQQLMSMAAVSVDRGDWDFICIAAIQVSNKRLHTPILSKSLRSDLFLEFDPTTGAFKESMIHVALGKLEKEVTSFSRAQGEPSIAAKVMKIGLAHKGRKTVDVPVQQLIEVQSLLDRALNIVRLTTALLKHIEGNALILPELRPVTPIADQVEEIEEERVSDEDLTAYLDGQR